jgi:hypothetical protein
VAACVVSFISAVPRLMGVAVIYLTAGKLRA